MTQWVSTDTDQWVGNDTDQWIIDPDYVEYTYEATKYNLVALDISYYLEAMNKDFYFVAEDKTNYIEGE